MILRRPSMAVSLSNLSVGYRARSRPSSDLDVCGRPLYARETECPLMCRFLDAAIRGSRHAQLTGVQKAPRHEVAGSWAPAGQPALWGFDVSADLDGGWNTARQRSGCVDRRGGEPAMGISASARSASAGAHRIESP